MNANNNKPQVQANIGLQEGFLKKTSLHQDFFASFQGKRGGKWHQSVQVMCLVLAVFEGDSSKHNEPFWYLEGLMTVHNHT